MANLEMAYLATIQRFRDYYKDAEAQEVALRPMTVSDGPLIKELTNDSPEQDINAEYDQDYHVAALANEIITEPYKYLDVQNKCWEVYQTTLDYMETTALLHQRWQDAKIRFDLSRTTSPSSGMRFYNTLVNELHWEEETLEENEFVELVNRAEEDEVFMRAFKETYGEVAENADEKVIQVKFMRAEVNIIRPWLDKSLLKSQDWRLKGTINAKAYLSDDAPDRIYTGAMPGFPIKFVLVKDISIKFQTQEGEKEEDKKGPLLHFGPLLLNGMIQWTGNTNYVLKGLKAYNSTSDLIKQNLVYNLKEASIEKENNELKYVVNNQVVKPTFSYQPQAGLQQTNLKNFSTLHNTKYTPQSTLGNTRTSSIQVPRFQTRGVEQRFTARNFATSRSTYCLFKGRVIDQDSRGLAGVDVLIRDHKSTGTSGLTKLSTDDQGNFEVELTQKQAYQIVLVRDDFEKVVDDFTVKKEEEMDYVKRLTKVAKQDKVEVESEIQLLAIIYEKLGKVPNPRPDFVPVGDGLDGLAEDI